MPNLGAGEVGDAVIGEGRPPLQSQCRLGNNEIRPQYSSGFCTVIAIYGSNAQTGTMLPSFVAVPFSLVRAAFSTRAFGAFGSCRAVPARIGVRLKTPPVRWTGGCIPA